MTQETRVIANKLVWQQDQNAANAVIQSNKAIAGSLAPIKQQADLAYDAMVKSRGALADIRQAADAAYAARVQQLESEQQASAASVSALQKQAAEVQDLTDLYKGLEDQAAGAQKTIHDIGLQSSATKQLEPAFGTLPGEGDTVSSSGASSGLRGIRQGLIALPGVGFQSPLVVGLRGVEAIADKTGASLLQLGVAGGLAGAALIAIKLIFDQFTQTIANAKKQLDGALSAQTNYYNALANSTSDQVREQIAGLERVRDAQRQQLSELQNAVDSAFKQLQSQFGDAGARALIASGQTPFNQLQAQLDDLNKQYTDNDQTITRLTQGLENNAFAANDARDAEEKLQKTREDSAHALNQLYEQEASTRQSLAALRRTGADELANFFDSASHVSHNLTDQVNAVLDSDNDRATLIRNFLLPALAKEDQSLQVVKDQTHAYNVELDQLTEKDKLIVQAVLPVVQARQDELDALKADKEYSDALNDSLQDINKTQVDLADASQKTADALDAVKQAETDHAAKLLDIQATYDDAAATALTKKNEQLAKIDANAAERALQQRENDNLTIEQLVSRGQIAEAQYTIRQQAVKRQQDERQIQQQKTDAQKSYDDQLKAARDQNTKLLQSEQERYDKELADRQKAYNKALEDQQALNNRLQELRSQNAFLDQYWTGVVTAAYDKLRNAQSQLTDSTNASVSAVINNIQRLNAASGASGGSSTPFGYSFGQSAGSLLSSIAQTLSKTINNVGNLAPNGAPYQQPLFYSGFKESAGTSTPLPPVTGTAGGGGKVYLFDTPSYNTRPGLYLSKVPEYHIPAADFNRMNMVGGGSPVIFNIDARGSTISESEWQRRLEPVKADVIQKLTERNNRVRQKTGGV